MAQVVVIGAGVGGMAVAARLAVKGHRVTVVEAADTAGGKLAGYHRDGFAFDTGPTLLTLPAVYRDLFLKTGGALEDSVDLQPVDPAFHYRFADGTTLVTPGAGVAGTALAIGEALGEPSADGWRTLMQRAARMWALTRRPVLETPLTGMRDLMPLARDRGALRTITPWRTMRGLGRSTLPDPRARQVFDRYATYAGSDPRRAPAVLATIPYVEATFGIWHVGGGLHRLAAALQARLAQRKATLLLSTPVERIERADGGQVSGVRLADGSVLPADVVVADADAALVHDTLLPPGAATAQRRRLAAATPSMSGFTLLLAVRGRTPGIAHHNVWFPRDHDRELDAVFGRHPCPAADPAIYACVPDDPAMHPAGDEAWSILVNAPRHSPGGADPGTVDWDAPGLAQQYASAILDALAERGTDLRDRIAWQQLRTPADLQRSTRAPGGAIYGTAAHGPRSSFLRATNASAVPGLYLVGGSAHPGGGLPLVGMSAEIVANLIGRA